MRVLNAVVLTLAAVSLLLVAAKESPEQGPVRRLDTLAGLTIGSSKSTRSLPPPIYPMDTLGLEEVSLTRLLGGRGGSRHLDGGAYFRPVVPYLGLAAVGRGRLRSDKRLDTLGGMTLGQQKRTFDEIDRTAFDELSKRDFDEIDRTGFDGFSK